MARAPFAAYVTGFPIPQQRHMGMHRHDHVEIVHHLTGNGTSTTGDGQELAFAAGDACVYPACIRHDRRYAAATSACLVVRLHVDPPLPAELRRSRLVRGPLPPWLLSELHALAGPQAPCSGMARLALDHRASAVLCGLLALAGPAHEVDADAALAERAASLIAERFARIGRLDDLARELGVDYDRLRRVFRRHRGTTLIAWLTAVRARRAQELLANSHLTHADIARQCGYGSARYLNRIFRRQFGVAPGSTRK